MLIQDQPFCQKIAMVDLSYTLDQLIKGHDRICEILYEVAPYQDWRPLPSEWSFRLIGAHLAKIEQEAYLVWLDGMLTGNNQTFTAYWNTEAGLGRPELTDSIILWKERRRRFVERVKLLRTNQLENSVKHDIYGDLTAVRLVEVALNHDSDHLSHLLKIFKQFEDEE